MHAAVDSIGGFRLPLIRDAVNTAFDKAEELLLLRLIPLRERVA
jgi:hypothetical protein